MKKAVLVLLFLLSAPLLAQVDITIESDGTTKYDSPLKIAALFTLDDNTNTVCIGLDGDRLYHDTDCGGSKGAGEQYIDLGTDADDLSTGTVAATDRDWETVQLS